MVVVWGSCRPIYVRKLPDKAVLTTEEVLWSMCWPVLVLGKIEKAVFTTVEVLWGWWKTIYVPERRGKSLFPSCCEARVGLFKCLGRSRKQFSLLWKSCEACASQFMWGKDLVTPFYPPRRICEAHFGLFMCQRRSWKQFSPLWELSASMFVCGIPCKAVLTSEEVL